MPQALGSIAFWMMVGAAGALVIEHFVLPRLAHWAWQYERRRSRRRV